MPERDTKPVRGALQASGRFLLRLPPVLHSSLRNAARDAGLSLNDYCCRKLSAPGGNAVGGDGPAAAVGRAAELFGEHLLAVIVYGSWARGDDLRESDVDLLVILDRSIPINRDLYRRWDAQDLAIDGHPVEPHFVHLRGADQAWTGLWVEAAMDGIVLFEKGLEVSRRLVATRHDVVSGRLVRKTVHGQPYWSEVA